MEFHLPRKNVINVSLNLIWVYNYSFISLEFAAHYSHQKYQIDPEFMMATGLFESIHSVSKLREHIEFEWSFFFRFSVIEKTIK